MTAPLPVSTTHARPLGTAFDTMTSGLVLVGAPPAVGKTCLSLNLAAHFAAHLGEAVLYFSPAAPREVILARLAKNLTPAGETVDVACVADLPLVVVDSPNPTSQSLLESAEAYVQQHGQPGLVLVNDLQSLRPGKDGLTGLASAIDIMADMRAISKLCDAPLVLLSQLAEGKGISQAIREQADRVVTVQMATEDPATKVLSVAFADPPEKEDGSYELALARSTGVLALR
jgi:replicative DNA helicase